MTIVVLIQILQKLAKSHEKRVFFLKEMVELSGSSHAAAAMTLLRAAKKGLVGRTGNLWINLMDPPDLLEVAFHLVSPSYVSFESALYHHGILSQAPRGNLTMATSTRSRVAKTPLGTIQYIHLKPSLFFGFDKKRVAFPEKAWLDVLYIRGLKGRKNILTEKFYLEDLDVKKIKKWGRLFPAWVKSMAIFSF